MSLEHLQYTPFLVKPLIEKKDNKTEKMHIYCRENSVNFMVFMVAGHSQQLLKFCLELEMRPEAKPSLQLVMLQKTKE